MSNKAIDEFAVTFAYVGMGEICVPLTLKGGKLNKATLRNGNAYCKSRQGLQTREL